MDSPVFIDCQASQEEKEAAFRVESDTPGAGAAGLNAGSYELQGIAVNPGHVGRGWCYQQGLTSWSNTHQLQ